MAEDAAEYRSHGRDGPCHLKTTGRQHVLTHTAGYSEQSLRGVARHEDLRAIGRVSGSREGNYWGTLRPGFKRVMRIFSLGIIFPPLIRSCGSNASFTRWNWSMVGLSKR